MRERVIEQYLYKRVKELGGMCVKQEARYNAGIPDRLVLLDGCAYFVEVKAPGKTPTPKQLIYHSRLENIGFEVTVIDSKQGVDEFIDELIDSVWP